MEMGHQENDVRKLVNQVGMVPKCLYTTVQCNDTKKEVVVNSGFVLAVDFK